VIDKNIARSILADQWSEVRVILERCAVEREWEKAMAGDLDDDLVKVITGVRRCGKSALAHRILRDKAYGYINFDDERLLGVCASDLNVLWETLLEDKPDLRYLLLDEIQNVEGWELFVNRLQRNGIRVVLTGSNAHLLSRELATHLTGRHRLYEVYPYSFKEYLRAHQRKGAPGDLAITRKRAELAVAFRDYFKVGGFPEIEQVANPRLYLQDLYDKVLIRDIAVRHGVRHLRTFKDIAFYVANNCGSRLSYQNIKNAYSLGSLHTVKNYLDYLRDAYLFFAVDAFSQKIKERVRLPRKMYGIDVALVRATSMAAQKNIGHLLENLVYLEFLRRGIRVDYYGDAQRQYEVDFLWRDPGTRDFQLIQVCADLESAETRERELRGLVNTAKALGGIPDRNLRILTLDRKSNEKAGDHVVECLPVWEWLLRKNEA
jgi:predicted AAA+ superfamily ATPase